MSTSLNTNAAAIADTIAKLRQDRVALLKEIVAVKSLAECGIADSASERKRHLEEIRDIAAEAIVDLEGNDEQG